MDINKLKGHVPESIIKQIPTAMDKFGINNVLRLSHFLSQCSHESGGFKSVRENLNYSAQGLANTWPTRYSVNPKVKPLVPNELAKQIEKKPEVIANKTYANRMGNGSEESGDGFKYIGRGYIQLTGKDNYREFGRLLDVDLLKSPDKVATDYPLLSGAWFFSKNGLNTLSDKGSTEDVVKSITKKINGGTIGIDHRLKEFKKFHDILK
jgi:putative chitinase